MSEDKESPERRRERMRQEELKRNPTGNMNDAFNKANSERYRDTYCCNHNSIYSCIVLQVKGAIAE